VWPERDGVAERIEWCRRQQAGEDRMMAVLESALTTGQAGDPEGALRVLAGVTPTEEFNGRFERARRTLTDQLASMDAQPPEIFVPTDLEMILRKNTTFVVPITVTDDYRVERVIAHVRKNDESGFREIPLESTDAGLYPFEITPALHGNKKLFFYVTAEDRSGHRSNLWSADQPQLLKRKGLLRR
jgi:hypothetical protein